MNNATSCADDETIIYAAQIAARLNYTGRGLRKLIARGVFPKPDGNLLGRDYWHTKTYRDFLADMHAGKFRMDRRPGQPQSTRAA